jgi:hypothetical protein
MVSAASGVGFGSTPARHCSTITSATAAPFRLTKVQALASVIVDVV